jgi:hypothetical protein
MAKQRMISTAFWDEDEWRQTLDPNQSYFYLYLLTNPKVSLCGIYRILLGHMKLETGLPAETIAACLKKLQDEKKIICKDGWIILLNRRKHNKNTSPKISRGIERELEDIPDEIKELLYNSKNAPKTKSKKSKTPQQLGFDSVNVFADDSDEYALSKMLFDWIVKNHRTHKYAKFDETEKEGQIQKFCVDADLILRVDEREFKHALFLMEWCQQSNFWKANIMSMGKFREQFDTLTAQAQRDFEKAMSDKKKKEFPKNDPA